VSLSQYRHRVIVPSIARPSCKACQAVSIHAIRTKCQWSISAKIGEGAAAPPRGADRRRGTTLAAVVAASPAGAARSQPPINARGIP